MIRPTRKQLSKKRKSKAATAQSLAYQSLEERRLLATSFTFDQGLLTVQMSESGDYVDLDATISGAIRVNKQDIFDQAGNLATTSNVTDIVVNGSAQPDQEVILYGEFTNGNLRSMTLRDMSSVEIVGDVALSGDLTVISSSADGQIIQEEDSQFVVEGDTYFDYNNIVGFLGDNDFQGQVSSDALATYVFDRNAIVLGSFTSPLANIRAGTEVTQTANSAIENQGQFLVLAGSNVRLTNSSNDFTEVHVEAENLSISDKNSIVFSEVVFEANMNVDARGDVTSKPTSEYEFNGDLRDTHQRNSDLTPIGTGSLENGGFRFAKGEGLKLQTIAAQSDYFIELEMSFDSFATWNRVIDFKEGTSDSGLYAYRGKLQFYRIPTAPSITGSFEMEPSTTYKIGLERSGEIVTGYINGIEQFSFVDSQSLAVADTELRFFKDNGSGFEDSAGFVESISIHKNRFIVGGNFSVNTSGDILLDKARHGVGGPVSLTGNNIRFTAGDKAAIRKLDAGGNARIKSERIFDIASATTNVNGELSLSATQVVNLGDSANDVFNAGRINLNVKDGNVFLQEDSGLRLSGINQARYFSAKSTGAISDTADATTTISVRADLTGQSIQLGDTAVDTFDAATLTLNSDQNATVTSDLRIVLTGESQVRGDLLLRSNENVVDTRVSKLTVDGHFRVEGSNVSLGDQPTDEVNARSFSFKATNHISYIQNNLLKFARISLANSGAFRSIVGIENFGNARLRVDSTAALNAPEIRVGVTPNDLFRFGRLNLVASGMATVHAEGNIVFNGASNVGSLNLLATGTIKDVANSVLNVDGHVRFNGTQIIIGDSSTDRFRSNSLAFQSPGTVSIEANSDIRLGGTSRAKQLYLNSTGAISDTGNANTIVEEVVSLEGIDIIIGDMENDCFDILAGIDGLFTKGTGLVDVTLGC